MKSRLAVFFHHLTNIDFTDAIRQGAKEFAKPYHSNSLTDLEECKACKSGGVTETFTVISKIETEPVLPDNDPFH